MTLRPSHRTGQSRATDQKYNQESLTRLGSQDAGLAAVAQGPLGSRENNRIADNTQLIRYLVNVEADARSRLLDALRLDPSEREAVEHRILSTTQQKGPTRFRILLTAAALLAASGIVLAMILA